MYYFKILTILVDTICLYVGTGCFFMAISVNQTSSSLSFIDRISKERDDNNEKLASAKRINGADDDPAGLQISSRLTAEINQSQQLSYNSQDEINYNNVQAGGLSAINESLQRANELSIQSGNPTTDANAIQGELDQLTEQINTIASEVLGQDNFISGLDANDPAATQDALTDAFATIGETATALGANTSSLVSQVSTYETSVVNVSASRSRIEDTDYSAASAKQQETEVLLQAAVISSKNEESRKGLLVNQLV